MNELFQAVCVAGMHPRNILGECITMGTEMKARRLFKTHFHAIVTIGPIRLNARGWACKS